MATFAGIAEPTISDGPQGSAMVAPTNSPTAANRNAVPLGHALETTRRAAGYSKGAAALRLGVTLRELDHYETGIRTPSVVTLGRIARLYDVELERFAARPYVPRVPPRIDRLSRTLTMGWVVIDLSPIDENPDDRNAYLLGALADALRAMRTLTEAQPVYLRRAELPLLATLLDIDHRELPLLIMRHLSLTLTESTQLVAALKQARGF